MTTSEISRAHAHACRHACRHKPTSYECQISTIEARVEVSRLVSRPRRGCTSWHGSRHQSVREVCHMVTKPSPEGSNSSSPFLMCSISDASAREGVEALHQQFSTSRPARCEKNAFAVRPPMSQTRRDRPRVRASRIVFSHHSFDAVDLLDRKGNASTTELTTRAARHPPLATSPGAWLESLLRW